MSEPRETAEEMRKAVMANVAYAQRLTTLLVKEVPSAAQAIERLLLTVAIIAKREGWKEVHCASLLRSMMAMVAIDPEAEGDARVVARDDVDVTRHRNGRGAP